MPLTQIDKQQGVIFGGELRRDGMTDILHAGESGDHQRQRRGHLTGFTAFLPAGFHRHGVFAHRNSQAELRTQLFAYGFHRVVQTGVFTRVAGSRHPVSGKLDALDIANLGRRDIGERFAHRETARGCKVEQRYRRAFAKRHGFAIVAVEAGGGYRTVRHRDLPRAHHLIARDHPGHGTVADGNQEGFFRDGRQMQHAVHRVGDGDGATVQGIACGLAALDVAGHFRGFAQQDVQRHIDRLIIEMAVVKGQVLFLRRFANYRVRRAFTAAQLIE